LGSALAERGFTDVTLRWTQTLSPKRVIQKVNNAKRESVLFIGTITYKISCTNGNDLQLLMHNE